MHLLDFIFPKFCVNCGRIGEYICFSCQKSIKPILQFETICPVCELPALAGNTHPRCSRKYTLDGLISFFHYQGAIKKAIKSIKYQFNYDIINTVTSTAVTSRNLMDAYLLLKNPTLVPIPLHPSRYKYRGFNQAELFAKTLSTYYHLPFERDMIRRTKSSIPQVETNTKQERLRNMKDMFALSPNKCPPKYILLIDDVFTTGATMREAGKVLKQSGGEIVWGLTIAR